LLYLLENEENLYVYLIKKDTITIFSWTLPENAREVANLILRG